MAKTQTWQNRIVGYGEESPDQLLANPLNFRTHPKNQQDTLSGVLSEVGIVQNVIVNRATGYVIDGHLRISLAMREQQPTVPVTYVDLTPSEEALILATLDPISAMANADRDKLDELLREVSTSDAAVMQMLSDLAEEHGVVGYGGTDLLTDPDEVPEPPVDPITRPGDLWLLGRHRLLCGDSTNAGDVARLMGGEKADMVFTDPPYGMDHDPAMSARPMPKGNWINEAKQYSRVIGDDAPFDPSFLLSTFAYCAEIFVWGADYFAESIAGRNDGSWIVWDKREGLETVQWSTSEFELCWSKQKHHRKIARIRWMGLAGTEQEFDKKRVHPTQKPIALAEWFLNQWSKPDHLVVDLFGGSGSALIACEQTGRRCAMMELDPRYCDVIVTRWENATGQTATRESVAMAAD